jgi:hypothetical protein
MQPTEQRYIVTFIEEMPSIGPSEVAHAEVLDSGWVRVQWRNALDGVSFYPPHVVVSVKTPSGDRDLSLLNRIRLLLDRLEGTQEVSTDEGTDPEQTQP